MVVIWMFGDHVNAAGKLECRVAISILLFYLIDAASVRKPVSTLTST